MKISESRDGVLEWFSTRKYCSTAHCPLHCKYKMVLALCTRSTTGQISFMYEYYIYTRTTVEYKVLIQEDIIQCITGTPNTGIPVHVLQ